MLIPAVSVPPTQASSVGPVISPVETAPISNHVVPFHLATWRMGVLLGKVCVKFPPA